MSERTVFAAPRAASLGEPAQTGSLWEALSPAGPHFAPLEGEVQADLVVAGGGFLGLSCALHAARAGLGVVLLEAHQPGFGASGRNTGFVVPSLKSSIGPAEAEAALGAGYAERLLRLVAGSGRLLFDLVAAEGIDCAAEAVGWLQPGHTAAAAEVLRGRLARLLAAGVDAAFLEREAMLAKTGLAALHGGLEVRSGGLVNPLAYARGLAGAAHRAGADIRGDSPVVRLERSAAQWRVETPGGAVTAPRVLLATNAMAGWLVPGLRASIIPARVFQIATQVLPGEWRERLLPAGAPVADTRRHTFALRWSPDGRLVTGGMVAFVPDRMAEARRSFTRRLARFIPGLPPLRADYTWTGVIAGTPDFLPRMIEAAPGLHGAIGCSGRGVALTTALGRELAALAAGAVSPADFVLPITPPRPLPFARLAGIGPHLWLPWSNFRDDREAGRITRSRQRGPSGA